MTFDPQIVIISSSRQLLSTYQIWERSDKKWKSYPMTKPMREKKDNNTQKTEQKQKGLRLRRQTLIKTIICNGNEIHDLDYDVIRHWNHLKA